MRARCQKRYLNNNEPYHPLNFVPCFVIKNFFRVHDNIDDFYIKLINGRIFRNYSFHDLGKVFRYTRILMLSHAGSPNVDNYSSVLLDCTTLMNSKDIFSDYI